MDPQLQQEILGLGSEMDPQAAQIKRQQALANILRQKSMQPQEGIQAGRIYKAPGYASLLGNVAQGLMANKMQGQSDQQMGQVNQQQIGTKQKYLDSLRMALRRPPPQVDAADIRAPDGMEDR